MRGDPVVTVIDDKGTRYELEGNLAAMVLALVEYRRAIPEAGKVRVEFDCADSEVVMSPRVSFRVSARRRLPS